MTTPDPLEPAIEAAAKVMHDRDCGCSVAIDRVYRRLAEHAVRAAAPIIAAQQDHRSGTFSGSLDEAVELIASAICTRTWGHSHDGVPCSACRKEAAILAGQLAPIIAAPIEQERDAALDLANDSALRLIAEQESAKGLRALLAKVEKQRDLATNMAQMNGDALTVAAEDRNDLHAALADLRSRLATAEARSGQRDAYFARCLELEQNVRARDKALATAERDALLRAAEELELAVRLNQLDDGVVAWLRTRGRGGREGERRCLTGS